MIVGGTDGMCTLRQATHDSQGEGMKKQHSTVVSDEVTTVVVR